MSRSLIAKAAVSSCKRRVHVSLATTSGTASPPTMSEATITIPWLLDNCVSLRHPTGQRGANFYGEKGGSTSVVLPKEVLSVDLLQCSPNSTESDAMIRGGALPTCVRSLEAAKVNTSATSPSTTTTTEVSAPLTSLLRVQFTEGKVSYVPFHSIDKYVLMKPSATPWGSSISKPPVTTAKAVHRVNYEDVMGGVVDGDSEAARIKACGLKRTPATYNLLRRLAADGLVVVEGCGVGEEAVKCLAALVGGTGMPLHTMYGTHWHVQSAPVTGPKNNVAYSTASLDLHQDLVYHESMPGVQLLHCQSFHSSVKGGLSSFLDINVWMKRFKLLHPEAYTVLTKVPAAFMKDDMEREEPAQYYYATPHIHENDKGEFLKLFWAPAFEAPLPIRDPDVAEQYYAARGKMCDVMQELVEETSSECKAVRFQLKEGDCVIFLQGRMMHGRDAFTEESACSRRLHGAYVELESFRNKVTSLAVEHKDEDALLCGDLCQFFNRSYR